jgi:hypothetical protein
MRDFSIIFLAVVVFGWSALVGLLIEREIYEKQAIGAQIISPSYQKYWHLKTLGESSMG